MQDEDEDGDEGEDDYARIACKSVEESYEDVFYFLLRRENDFLYEHDLQKTVLAHFFKSRNF